MKRARLAAAALIAALALVAVAGPAFLPHRYDEQFRDHASESPSASFPLGTDDLGRDRLARLIYATRVSLALATASALVSIALALAFAGLTLAGLAGPIDALTTICLSLPWIFLFIILRGVLPLNTSPAISILLTFGLMGVAGWASPARVFSACLGECLDSEWMLQARASGMSAIRMAVVHLWPHIRAVAAAQLRALIPAYILAEASLGLLGLGVAEPATSWGNLIAELQRVDTIRANPWVLAPLGLLASVTVSLELLRSGEEGLV